jgi:hypothetical protein
VAAPVLTEVYKANDLQRFGSYEDFNDPAFSISMRRHERLTALPRDLMDKILLDTLNTWAKQADERKGATKYNVAVLSTNILPKDVLEREDYLVAIDILRSKTNRVLDTLTKIAELSGAKTIGVGAERVTLAEVRAGLEDVIRFKLEPLLGLIRSEGVTKNARGLALYANNQLFQVRLEKQEAAERVRGLQDSVREFTSQRGSSPSDVKSAAAGSGSGASNSQALMPQIDQSFLDRLMTLSTARADSEYRRKLTDRIITETDKLAAMNRQSTYYEDLVGELRGAVGRQVGSPEAVGLIKSRSTEAFNEITKGIEQTAAIYREISALNLNPSTTVFAVTGPFALQTQRSLTVRTVGLYFVLIMMLTLILVPIGCLVHHAFKKHA